jgi:hypothetical protein
MTLPCIQMGHSQESDTAHQSINSAILPARVSIVSVSVSESLRMPLMYLSNFIMKRSVGDIAISLPEQMMTVTNSMAIDDPYAGWYHRLQLLFSI